MTKCGAWTRWCQNHEPLRALSYPSSMLIVWMRAICIVLLAASGARAANELSAAERAYADVDYSKCRDKAQAALATPGTQAQRVQAHRLLGLCAAALSDVDVARDAFRAMLVIDHSARLPEGLSPRFTSSFREAKGSLVGRKPLLLETSGSDPLGARRLLHVQLTDELSLVHRLGWRAGDGIETLVKPSASIDLDVPGDLSITLRAIDAAQGELAVLEVPPVTVASAVPGPAAAVINEDNGPSWWLVGGVIAGVVLLGAGAGTAAAVLLPPQRVQLQVGVDVP
jgi:hypothetical protein